MNRAQKLSGITKGQVKAIKTAQKHVFKSDEDYRFTLSQNFGVNSCTALTYYQAQDLIKRLAKLTNYNTNSGSGRPTSAGVSSSNYRGRGKRGTQKHLTQLQADRITLMEKLLGWKPESTTKFIKRQTGNLTGVQMLMNWQAVKVIVGMQRILSENLGVDYSSINKADNETLKNLTAD